MTEKWQEKMPYILLGMLVGAALLALGVHCAALFCLNEFYLEMELNGQSAVTVEYGSQYEEAGVRTLLKGTLLLRRGRPVDAALKVAGDVREDSLGTYVITYLARYKDLSQSISRTVQVVDTQAPVIELFTDPEDDTLPGRPYREEGFAAWDNYDGDLTDRVIRKEEDGIVRYFVQDSSGNTAEAVREIRYYDPDPLALGKVIYLTFDDGPSRNTARLLEILDRYNVKVTFFAVSGKYNDLLTQIAAAGHSIGIHSATHDYQKIYASEEAFFQDLNEMKQIIQEKTGITTTLIRFPGGSSNTVSSFNRGIMTRLTQAVQDQGYQYFDWNVSSGDAGDTTDPEEVFQNVIKGIQTHDISVVLLHDSKSYSVDAVEHIIIWGLENGYTFLPLESDSPVCHHRVNN